MIISPEGVRDGIIKTGTQASKKIAESITSQGDAVKAATEKITETVIEEDSSKAEGLGVFLGNLKKVSRIQRRGA